MKASRRGGWGRFIIPSDFTPTSSLQAVTMSPLIYLPTLLHPHFSLLSQHCSSAFLLSSTTFFSHGG
ncbi:hypothetical protein HanRHA438_Chr17g0823911 [Helianthus annuus]|nr:hypothetical protein HanHA89_Chr17g0715601 [Helianthus annuus]KAJ0633218.1 hypothetical protein HanLR1_Chr17g0674101 [Helianthus annuus]KAJ0827283.1 hypothetical protein HanRHA438_Chr17g0823911 [Helianthus annuus]